jgi:TM2 domain-containing membrane protein YozV
MKGFRRTIGLTILLIGCLSVRAYSLTNKPQSYVFRNSWTNRLPNGNSVFLFFEQRNDSNKVSSSDSRKLKSPWMAFGIALVPGAIIHGAGHFYAGKIGTGFVLLGSELVGTGLIAVGLVGGIETITGKPREGWVIELEAGLVLFVGSWIYDIIGSPIVVMKSNKDLLQRKPSGLKIQIKDGNVKLVTIWSF